MTGCYLANTHMSSKLTLQAATPDPKPTLKVIKDLK